MALTTLAQMQHSQDHNQKCDLTVSQMHILPKTQFQKAVGGVKKVIIVE